MDVDLLRSRPLLTARQTEESAEVTCTSTQGYVRQLSHISSGSRGSQLNGQSATIAPERLGLGAFAPGSHP